MSSVDDWVVSLCRKGDTVLRTAEREDCLFAFLRRPPSIAVFAYRRLVSRKLDPIVRLGLQCSGPAGCSTGPAEQRTRALPAPRKGEQHMEFSLPLPAEYQGSVKFYFQASNEPPFFGLVEWTKA